MKEYLVAIGMFIGFFLLCFSGFITSVTLLNDYLIYSSAVIIGLIVALFYFFNFKEKITDKKEYIYVPIRSILSIGVIIVFIFLWSNYFWREQKIQTIVLPIKENYLDKTKIGSKFSTKIRIKSAFVVEYNKLNKDIIWHTRLEDSIIARVQAIEIKKSNGLFGIDIIEETDLKY